MAENCPTLTERYQPTDSKSLMNPQHETYEENHTLTHQCLIAEKGSHENTQDKRAHYF